MQSRSCISSGVPGQQSHRATIEESMAELAAAVSTLQVELVGVKATRAKLRPDELAAPLGSFTISAG
jgi:hypothetical protein